MVDRKKRVPLGVARQNLAVSGKHGFQRRWVNDVGNRVKDAIDGGYALVQRDDAEFEDKDVKNHNDSLGNAVSKVVDKTEGTKGYLMEITNILYNADQIAKGKAKHLTEDALRQGADSNGRPGADGRYVPKEGIKIKN